MKLLSLVLPTAILTIAGVGLVSRSSTAVAADPAVQTIVANDSTDPVPVTPNADTTIATFGGVCVLNVTTAYWLTQVHNLVPSGKRLIIDQFSIHLAIPSTTMAHVEIRPWDPSAPGGGVLPRLFIPLENQGAGFDYLGPGAGSIKILNAMHAVRGVVEHGEDLNIGVMLSTQVGAFLGDCSYSLVGHFVPAPRQRS